MSRTITVLLQIISCEDSYFCANAESYALKKSPPMFKIRDFRSKMRDFTDFQPKFTFSKHVIRHIFTTFAAQNDFNG